MRGVIVGRGGYTGEMSARLDHPPVATYRIQLTPSFGFADTIGILDHLVALGVSHLYLSPVSEAVPGSLHGYDVIDHTRVRSDFGGEDGLVALLNAAHDHGLGVVIDHVPNHMSVAEAHLNDRWWEMLRDGPDSSAASWFDVDWDATEGKVIVPKLGDPLDELLGSGGLSIGDGDRGPELRYGPLRFPLAPGTEQLDVADAVDRQHYRLQWWRDPPRNVRRFFTIDDLVAVRAEVPAVAEVIDTIPARLADHPAFAGVRVDHVDGLAQPEAYLAGLRGRIGDHRWLLVEKILAPGEVLAPSWPVDGTTGYEHIRVSEHTFLDPSGRGTARTAVDRVDRRLARLRGRRGRGTARGTRRRSAPGPRSARPTGRGRSRKRRRAVRGRRLARRADRADDRCAPVSHVSARRRWPRRSSSTTRTHGRSPTRPDLADTIDRAVGLDPIPTRRLRSDGSS